MRRALLVVVLAGCDPREAHPPKGTDTGAGDSAETGGRESVDSDTADSDTGVPDSDSGPTETGETAETAETGDTGELPPCDRSRPWVFVDAGMVQTCGIHDDGCAECWGIGEEQSSSEWDTGGYHYRGEDQPPPDAFVMLDMLKDRSGTLWIPHTCGILEDGTAACWGDNAYGESDVPIGAYTDIAVSVGGTWAVLADGTVNAWGTPTEAPATNSVAEVEIGSYVMLMDTSGSLAGWVTSGAPYSVDVPSEAFIAIDVGNWYGCAVTSAGSALCWMYDDPDAAASCSLTVEAPPGPFIDICVESYGAAACALTADGVVTCWGDDSWPGSLKDYPVDKLFTQIACGFAHACGVTTDGGLECWGYDWYGETEVPT